MATSAKSRAGGPLSRAAARLAGCARGTISVEFALLSAFVFLPMIVIGTDLGRLALEWSRLTSAVRAAVQYGIRDQQAAEETDDIVAALRADLGDPTANPTVARYCLCPGSTTAVDCNDLCPDGGYAPMYVDVTHTLPVEMWFDYPGLPQPMSLTASARIRVR